jgi:hypothetical protein
MRTLSARTVVVVAVLVLASAVVACGDDDAQPATERVQTHTQVPRSVQTPPQDRARTRRIERVKRRAAAQRRAENRAQRRRERAQGRALSHSQPENAPGDDCADGYDPCVPPYPPDVDCRDLTGPYRVTGSDPHHLDPDGDGKACR